MPNIAYTFTNTLIKLFYKWHKKNKQQKMEHSIKSKVSKQTVTFLGHVNIKCQLAKFWMSPGTWRRFPTDRWLFLILKSVLVMEQSSSTSAFQMCWGEFAHFSCTLWLEGLRLSLWPVSQGGENGISKSLQPYSLYVSKDICLHYWHKDKDVLSWGWTLL